MTTPSLTFDECYKSQWPLSFKAIKDDTADEDMWNSYRMAELGWNWALEGAAAHFDGIAKRNALPITPEFAARQIRALSQRSKP